MKTLQTGVICMLLLLCASTATAQRKIPLNEPDHNKPHLFSDLPQKMPLRLQDMENLFRLKVGATVNTFLTDHFHFVGTVVSKSDPEQNGYSTVVIRATNRQGAFLTFTKTLGSDGVWKYRGRMISPKNGDALEITQENNQYVFHKKTYYDLVNE